MTAPVRISVLGLGLAGGRIHVPSLGRIAAARLVALCDPDPLRRAARWPAPGFERWEDALAVPAEGVVIATPPESHASLALAAIRANRHVYVEKPMATVVDEAIAMADAATASSRLLQVGFAYRFHPRWQEVRRMVAAGGLTRPLRARATFTTAGGSGWSDPVIDVACHHLDLMGWLLGAPPAEVAAGAGGGVVAWWPDGSELSGRYHVGEPKDQVSLSDGRRTVSINRLRRRGLLRGGRDVSFERAMAAFVAGVRAGRLVEGAAGPADGVASTRTILAIRRAVTSGRTEAVAVT